nr:hypothetical protein [uncultured Desulfobacter sp.]
MKKIKNHAYIAKLLSLLVICVTTTYTTALAYDHECVQNCDRKYNHGCFKECHKRYDGRRDGSIDRCIDGCIKKYRACFKACGGNL